MKRTKNKKRPTESKNSEPAGLLLTMPRTTLARLKGAAEIENMPVDEWAAAVLMSRAKHVLEAEDWYECPACTVRGVPDHYDVLGADGENWFCNQCNTEAVMENIGPRLERLT